MTLYQADILRLDPRDIAKNMGGEFRVVGNIPYYITSPILFWAIDAADVICDCTFMMQHEVARRLAATPRSKEYGILSVFAQYYSTPELKFTVSPGSFYPVPEVTSAVVSLNFRKPFPQKAMDDATFRAIVRGTFGTRRKMLRNGLRGLDIPADFFRQSKTNFERRPEELSVEDFVLLSNEITTTTGKRFSL